MVRFCSALLILCLATGCADSGSTVGQGSSSSQRTGRAQAAGDASAGRESMQFSKAKTPDTKTIVVKSRQESTPSVRGEPPRDQRDLERDKASFYPVLRNFREGDLFAKAVVNSPIAAGLGVFACRKIPMPNGGVRIDYVMKKDLEEYGLKDSDIVRLCYDNFFKEKIEVKALKQKGDLMLSFSSTGGLVTAILGHSSTFEKFARMLGTEDMAVMIDGAEHLLATPTGSSFEPTFYAIVKKSQHKTDALDLDSGVFHWTKKDGLKQASPKLAD